MAAGELWQNYPSITSLVAADTFLALDTTNDADSAAGTVSQVTAANAAKALASRFGRGLVANVLDYGAVGDGSTDNTAAFEAAIAAVTPADGVFDPAGTVFVPGGQFVTGPLVLPQRVGLLGTGMGSTIQLSSSASANSILISNSQDAGAPGNGAQECFVSNLRLDGNWGNRPSGSWDSAIIFTNTYSPTYPYEYSDARHLIVGVAVQYFTGDGIYADDSAISDTNIWSVRGFGFITASDANFDNCSAGGCGLDGFVVPGSSQLTNCKAWYCGSALTSGQYSGEDATALSVSSPANSWDGGSGITYSLANGYGNGFLLGSPASPSPEQNGNFGTLTGCYAQDNARAGFYVLQNFAVLSGCVADSNSNNGTSNGTSSGTPVGSFAGFDVAGAGCRVDGISFDRGSNLNHQAAALHVYEGTTGGKITLGFGGSLNDGSNMPPLMAGDVPDAPDLDMWRMSTYQGSGQGGGYLTDATYATGSYAIDPYVATTWDLTLSGNITLGNPALRGTNTTGTFLYPGRKLRFIIRQGSTVYSVSFGTAFNVQTLPSGIANSVSVLDFVYDGTTWQQTGAEVPATLVLGTTFNSGTGTSAQNVTGMATMLMPGKYLLKGRFWYTAHGTTGSTQTFAFTFGGTTSSVQGAWQFKTASYTAPVNVTALTTSSGLSPTLTTTTYALDWEAHAVVTAAGTLQLTVQSTTSGDEVSVLAGSYLTAQPVAA